MVEMKQLRDKHTGQYVSMKDAGKKELEIAIRLFNETEPESSQEKDALTDIRSAAELILILVATIGILMWIYFRMVGV